MGDQYIKYPKKNRPFWDMEVKMILVLLGTQNNSFYRLLEEIEKNIVNGIIKEDVIVQAGYTKFKTKKMKILSLVSKKRLQSFQEEASLIITHGGVGSIITSVKNDKKVIAVPRRHEYGEHVNNHQIDIVKNFNEQGYIIGIEKVEELEQAIRKAEKFVPKKYEINNELMLKTIEEFIDEV